jgi:hypothetical protein
LGANPLILFLRRQAMNTHTERKLAEIGRETAATLPSSPQAKLPGDTRALRGLPAIGRGVGGTMPGTQPEQETLERERRRRKTAERTSL